MAEKPASERTEKPTDERLKKAREKGQIPESREVPSATVIAVLLVGLFFMGGRLYEWLAGQVTKGLSFDPRAPMDNSAFTELLHARGVEFMTIMLPFFVLAIVGSCFGSFIAGGWAFSPKRLHIDISRISPINGIKNLLSLRAIVQLLVSMAKLTVILLITWWYLRDKGGELLSLQWTTPGGTVAAIGRIIPGLVMRITVGLGGIALVDLLYQRWNHKRMLRMTKQEVKEERRQHEISPETRSRMRSAQIAMTNRRMLRDVATADVVITNPDHYAVALKYDVTTMDSPIVVAKGADLLSWKIREIAFKHNVPIVQRPPLARTLYATVEVGHPVPEMLFVAVAEVLAMIYRLRKKKINLAQNTDKQ